MKQKYKLNHDLIVYDLDFKHTFTGSFFVIENNMLLIKKGFAWDGASFVPEGELIDGKPITWRATCLHDCLYRFRSPLTRKRADELFYRELKKVNFKMAYIYYVGVRIFGILYYKGKMK